MLFIKLSKFEKLFFIDLLKWLEFFICIIDVSNDSTEWDAILPIQIQMIRQLSSVQKAEIHQKHKMRKWDRTTFSLNINSFPHSLMDYTSALHWVFSSGIE